MDIIVGGPLKPNGQNVPTRVGEIVSDYSELANIPNPRVGMEVWVASKKEAVRILTLKEATIAGVVVPNAVVDTWEVVPNRAMTTSLANKISEEEQRAMLAENALRDKVADLEENYIAHISEFNTEVESLHSEDAELQSNINEIQLDLQSQINELGQEYLKGIEDVNRGITRIDAKAIQIGSFEVESLTDGLGINFSNIDGTQSDSFKIPTATAERAGVMSAEDKKVSAKLKVKVTDAKFTQQDYAGIYCTNVNTGRVDTANSTSNGIIIPVNEGDVFEIIGENLKYNFQSVQFYSGYPSLDTNIAYVSIKNNKVNVPQGATYMLVSVNPSLGTETTIRQLNWATIEDLPQSFKEVLENISSEYKTQAINVTQGTASGNNKLFPISLLSEGDSIQIYVKSDITVKMSLITSNDRVIQLITTNQIITKEVTADDITGDSFGFYINSVQATQSGTLNCYLRIVKKDSSPITLSKGLINVANSLDNTKKQVNSLEEVIESVVEIPVNNKNIKNWNTANKLVTRLYVENKERALADGLFVRQFFRALNSPTNNGFNFGTRNTGWAITIAPGIGDFDYYETTHAIYGKIAIKIADWDVIEWPASGAISIGGVLSESNLEDIVFDWNEFVKPLYPTVTIADGSVTENKLSEEVKDKLNSSAPPLSKYELFSLGDSLSAAGIWQTKVAQLTGCIFDQAKNNKAGAMLSVGGTSSFGNTFDNVLWRTKNLIDQNYITDNGENTIVILENVNDGYQVFNGDDKSIIPTTPIEGYNDADFGVELLESISDKATLNAVLRLNTVVAGKNLKIDTLPTRAGTVTLRVGWAGPGYSNYNIYVEPQATDEETLAHVLDRILEYAYTGITDVLGEDGVSVDFSSGNPNYLPTVQFTDTDDTGMICTVTDNPNAKGSVARYFIGNSIDEWTDTSKWQKGITYSQGWKSSIELLQRTYPKLHIFVSHFPLHAVTSSEYILPNGSYDTVAYNSVSRMETMRKMQVELGNIAKFYSIPLLDVFAECGIGINNMLTYYNTSANVHPKNEGYYRFGETVATQLKRYLL